MSRRALIALFATATMIAPAVPAAAAPAGDQFGTVLQQQLDAIHAAGMPGAFAEVRDGRRTWTPTTGVADIATGAPVRDGMRHRIGSITKTSWPPPCSSWWPSTGSSSTPRSAATCGPA